MSIQRCTLIALTWLVASCSTGTIAQLKDVKVDLTEEKVEGGLDKAIDSYQLNLDQSPGSKMMPETILRLADLKLQKEFNFSEDSLSKDKIAPLADEKIDQPAESGKKNPVRDKKGTGKEKSTKASGSAQDAINDFEKRTTTSWDTISSQKPGGVNQQSAGTREAIALYKKLLNDYPNYKFNDQALYQLARTDEELGNIEEAMQMMDRLAIGYPHSRYINEVQFRRGEYYYTRKKFPDAEDAYKVVVNAGAGSPYYEFALYKLGWTYYKQELYVEALHQFVALLDHKAAQGYNPNHPKESFDEKRIEDTYRVMSLSFSNLGGADAIAAYFNKYGKRAYETSVYKNLGDEYVEKRRYSDAAAAYKSFVKNNPYHKISPNFELWAIDTYKKGGFPKLVIEAKKEFVINYGLKSAYWTHFKIADFGEVAEYVRSSLKELAMYHHAQYQDKLFATGKDANFQEAVKWYREFLSAYPKDENVLTMHNQLAELLLENKSYGLAAVEYEHIAYDYPVHAKSAAAGYTAIYAYRESLATVTEEEKKRVKHEVIRSSLKFAETFSKHEKIADVLGAAVDDMYEAKDYPFALETSKRLLAKYAGAAKPIRRAAWLIFAHASFELGKYKNAEEGYLTALELTAKNDASRAGLIENLAASLYKQGEQANKLKEYKKAASYFLAVGTLAPTAKIRPVADFDGAIALIQIKDWDAAASVVSSFRINFPGHELQLKLTKQLAFAYKAAGMLTQAAAEYEVIETQSNDVDVRREALVVAGDLYIQAREMAKSYPVHRRYLSYFPKPLESALEIRNKIAIYLKTRQSMEYTNELRQIVEDDANAGTERTPRTRYLGATAALELAGLTIKQFAEIKLVMPIDKNLIKKKATMKAAKEQLEKLFNYEMDETTSAATFYLAEMYYNFSRILMESERPGGMNKLEQEQYQLSIEEQAYPFEEKAIQIHQQNLELMSRGIYNAWIDKSIEKLVKMMPARYAKFEVSSGFIEAIDTESYAALVEPKRAAKDRPTVPAVVLPVKAHADKQAVNISPEARADFVSAMYSIKAVDYERAIKLFNKIIAQYPDNPVPYINLALIYKKMRNLPLAEENLKLGIKAAPENPVVNNEYALLFRKTGRFTEARQIYDKILEKYPDFSIAHKNLGILCDIYMKDYECALKHYTIYIGLIPDDESVKGWVASIRGG